MLVCFVFIVFSVLACARGGRESCCTIRGLKLDSAAAAAQIEILCLLLLRPKLAAHSQRSVVLPELHLAGYFRRGAFSAQFCADSATNIVLQRLRALAAPKCGHT